MSAASNKFANKRRSETDLPNYEEYSQLLTPFSLPTG